LLRIVHDLCARGRTEFQLPSNLDIAALVAAREESVSRVIADMKRQGLLGLNASGNWVLAVL
jgi:hypothetical protein